MKKFFQKVLTALICISVLLVVFRGWFYRQFFSYKNFGDRRSYTVTDETFREYIDQEITAHKPQSASDVIQLALDITAARLHFSGAKNEIDPNKLMHSQAAHCVGYSAFFSATCNYILQQKNLWEWHSKPMAGQIYFLGINVHPYLPGPFLKDHDFNVIENTSTGKKYYVDPTLHDYSSIGYVYAHMN